MTIRCAALTPDQAVRAADQAAELLARDEVVAVPTETVYGLAGDASRPEALVKIFEAKGRPFFDPLIVHLPSTSWLDRTVEIPPEDEQLVQRLVREFWPGPLTLVLPRRSWVPDLATAGLPTVAVRLSRHPVLHRILERFGKPLAAPSANRFGRISPTNADHVLAELSGRIPLVVDAGPTEIGIESTIVKIVGARIGILRPGAVTAEALSALAEVTSEKPGGKAIAPGQAKSHYAPRTLMELVDHADVFRPAPGERCGLLAWTGVQDESRFAAVEVLSSRGDLREAATRLFPALRKLDESGLDRIIAERVPMHGLGAAIMDRLTKAAHHV